ncbi:MAG TPA: hypothetical protein VFW97_17575 [Acidimicrobiia bacterium]|jgi:hypothetical protein|nr:hypothetical protein [Acidimicrobiia bacterium]
MVSPWAEKDMGLQLWGTPVVNLDKSGMPTACPAWSLQFTRSVVFVRNSTSVPTRARSFWQALMTALRVSLAARWES